jgi:hypothetical protein
MQCDQFERILEEQGDASLPMAALAHMDVCEMCHGLAVDLGSIHDMAMELGTEGIAPPERLWVALRSRLEAEGIIRDARSARATASVGWWTAFQRPAFAGAFLGLILVGATAISYRADFSPSVGFPELAIPQQSAEVPSAESVFNEEVQTMENDAIPGIEKRDAAVSESIRRNLRIVDNFIVMCEKSVREQPDNEMAREYLYGAYQQKAELLAAATSRSMPGGLQ